MQDADDSCRYKISLQNPRVDFVLPFERAIISLWSELVHLRTGGRSRSALFDSSSLVCFVKLT